jgi:uncharacterized protein YndB with AHSA1/START domain
MAEMAMNIVKEADIAAPADKVYEYLLDFPSHGEWTTPGHGVQIRPTSAGPTSIGSTFISEAHQFGSQSDQITVTELVPNQRIVYEVVMKDSNAFRHTLELRPSGNGTHLTKRFQSLKLTLLSKLTLPLGWVVAPRLMAGDVKRMKARLEQPVSV